MSETEKTKIELQKENSNGLRGTLITEVNDESERFTGQAENLLKFHGMYQYKDRDRKKPGEESAPPKPFTLMVRGRIPGGRLTASQWIAWDEVANKYAVSGLRVTTRQSVQIHGVLKRNIKETIKEIHDALSSTTGACGDVVRNVMQPPNPWKDSKLSQLDAAADLLSKHFEVSSTAYFEIFLDGETVLKESVDPIYGAAYLPRKFKIGVTAVGNNSIDIYTQDLGLAATYNDHGIIDGYFAFVGGGMGMSHSDPLTKPRLADNLGWFRADRLLAVAEAVVLTQRDFGNRAERTFARLKYLIDSKGITWFESEVTKKSGVVFEKRHLPEWKTPNHLGWNNSSDGKLSLGFHTLSGRLIDNEKPLKSTLKILVEKYNLDVQLTAEQDVILLGILTKHKSEIEQFIQSQGLSAASPNKLYDRALTCVSLPTCVKALAEAERVGPTIFSQLETALQKHDLLQLAPTVRITGCPNGCARPFSAEIGLVGQMPGQYALYVGGAVEGTRLATKIKDKVKSQDLPQVFEALIGHWKKEGLENEAFGDFSNRVGSETFEKLL